MARDDRRDMDLAAGRIWADRDKLLAGQRLCILCGAPGTLLGIWRPTREVLDLLDVPADGDAILHYMLCVDCASADGAHVVKVGDKILAEAAEIRRAAARAGTNN